MFLGREKEAIEVYMAHRDTIVGGEPWDEAVPHDFRRLKEEVGIEHPLMVEIEKLLKTPHDKQPPK